MEAALSKRTDRIRQKLATGEACSGTWMALASPMAAEIIADAGFDFVVVDAEHNPFDPETLLHMLLAFRGSDTVPMIRVPWNDPIMIKQVLDMGFEGLVVPQTNTADDARQAVRACRYPPIGCRGFGPMRPGGYFRDGGEYVRSANDSIILAIQIENVSGAHEISDIVSVPGIDWILVGLYDMSASVGEWCNIEHPELWKACQKIMDAAHEGGIPAGIPLGGPDKIQKTLDLGSKLVFIGQDCAYLQSSVDHAVKTFRDIVDQRMRNT
jgi:2-keto-3-deoxy-L-rhamnonate aldolase RhmA